jgi:hypothetical protein
MRPFGNVGSSAFGEDRRFNGVKVFSATMVADRERLGEKITDWLQSNPKVEVRDAIVTQSSDEAFHCIAITLFYWDHSAA